MSPDLGGPSLHLVSLGCPKNRVDSELIVGDLLGSGCTYTPNPEDAEVIVVNTCGFVDEAKEESIDVILEMSDHRRAGNCKQLIVCGCLSQAHGEQLAQELPEVDHFAGVGGLSEISQILGHKHSAKATGRASLRVLPSVAAPPTPLLSSSSSPRVNSTEAWTSWVKIADGCSNTCAFCIIPKLRGPQRSRSVSDIVDEVRARAFSGGVEFNLVAQDLCAYGKDLADAASLESLLRQLDRLGDSLEKQLWVRCLYLYPRGLTKGVRRVIARSPHILPYLDMPLQHISDRLLRKMRRGKGGAATRTLLDRVRDDIPDAIIRTTLITGLPGETDADFNELCDFVCEQRFDHLGVFAYSPQEDSPAASFRHQVPESVATGRRDHLLSLQAEISKQQQAALIGQELDVLVEGESEETELLLQGRHTGQAPEVDGVTYITSGAASAGQVVRIRVDQSADYDVAGEMI